MSRCRGNRLPVGGEGVWDSRCSRADAIQRGQHTTPTFQKMIFQFPSGEYEIIALPISPAKLERQRNTTAKSSVCCTRNETVTFLYFLITEINSEVDTETLTGRGASAAPGKQASKSEVFQIISYVWVWQQEPEQSRTTSVVLFKLRGTKETNRGCRSVLNITRAHKFKLIQFLKNPEILMHDEHFTYWCWGRVKDSENVLVRFIT